MAIPIKIIGTGPGHAGARAGTPVALPLPCLGTPMHRGGTVLGRSITRGICNGGGIYPDLIGTPADCSVDLRSMPVAGARDRFLCQDMPQRARWRDKPAFTLCGYALAWP